MKKLLTLIMAFTMLLTLASCKEEEKEKPIDDTVIEDTADDGDIFAEREAVADGLGEYDFGGRTFRIITHRPQDFVVDEDQVNKGDLIKDATADRNKRVEDRFNCKVEVVYTSGYQDMNTYVTKNVMSGADEFDLLCAHTASVGSLVIKNLFLNWYDLPNVDFSKPWWPASTRMSSPMTESASLPTRTSASPPSITATLCSSTKRLPTPMTLATFTSWHWTESGPTTCSTK